MAALLLVSGLRRRRAHMRVRGRELRDVIVVGGGFGGLTAVRALAGAPARVTLLDRCNHHLFQPLLYQVATAALNPGDITAPLRSVLRNQANVEVMLAEVAAVEPDAQTVLLTDGTRLPYDYLVLAAGTTHSYFGHEDWELLAQGLKSIEDAVEIRRRILLAFERAEREKDPTRRRHYLNFVIVGGGPTGVELAGAISEIARHTLLSDFKHIDPESARVILVEGAPRLLPSYSEPVSTAARNQLERLGVAVHTGERVTTIDEGGVTIGERERVPARTVLWGAGVAAVPLARSLGVPLDRAGRVKVNRDLTVPGHPEIMVVGDLAAVEQAGGATVPGLAPAAIQEGRHAAQNVRRAIEGKPRLAFRYWDKGSLATIGRAAAVAQVGRFHFSGLPAWLAWLVIHIYFIIGFRNRVAVMLQWAWSYATFRRGSRLITDTAEQWRYIQERRAPAPPDAEPPAEPAGALPH
jgi:NADH dehydrogenase